MDRARRFTSRVRATGSRVLLRDRQCASGAVRVPEPRVREHVPVGRHADRGAAPSDPTDQRFGAADAGLDHVRIQPVSSFLGRHVRQQVSLHHHHQLPSLHVRGEEHSLPSLDASGVGICAYGRCVHDACAGICERPHSCGSGRRRELYRRLQHLYGQPAHRGRQTAVGRGQSAAEPLEPA